MRVRQGPNLQPLVDYVEAAQLHHEHKTGPSAERLSRSVGSEVTLPRLEENLEGAFEDGLMRDMILGIVLAETRRR